MISVHHDDQDYSLSAATIKSSSSSPSVTSPHLYEPPHKKRKPNVDEAILDTFKGIREDSGKKSNDLDEDYHFNMQMYSTLKNVQTRKKAIAKLHIHHYLTSVTLDLGDHDTSIFSQ